MPGSVDDAVKAVPGVAETGHDVVDLVEPVVHGSHDADKVLSDAGVTARRLPFQVDASLRQRITDLLERHAVGSQGELLDLLSEDGISVTQATLSRDLEELGAVKLRAADGGTGVYVVPEDGSPVKGVSGGTERLSRLLGELLAGIEARMRRDIALGPDGWHPGPRHDGDRVRILVPVLQGTS